MTFKHLITFVLLTTFLWVSKAQKQVWFDVETGLNNYMVQDIGHSPFIYAGQSICYGATINRQGERFLSSLHASITSSELEPRKKIENNFDLNAAYRNTIYSYYSVLRNKHDTKFHLSYGGSVSTWFDLMPFNNNGNNPLSYELSITINPIISLGYRISNWLEISVTESLPLAGYSIRPEALGLFPMNNFELSMGELLLGGSFVTLNKLFTVHTKFNSEFTIRKMKIAAFYEYIGGVNKVSERKAFSSHLIGIKLPLKFRWK